MATHLVSEEAPKRTQLEFRHSAPIRVFTAVDKGQPSRLSMSIQRAIRPSTA